MNMCVCGHIQGLVNGGNSGYHHQESLSATPTWGKGRSKWISSNKNEKMKSRKVFFWSKTATLFFAGESVCFIDLMFFVFLMHLHCTSKNRLPLKMSCVTTGLQGHHVTIKPLGDFLTSWFDDFFAKPGWWYVGSHGSANVFSPLSTS